MGARRAQAVKRHRSRRRAAAGGSALLPSGARPVSVGSLAGDGRDAHQRVAFALAALAAALARVLRLAEAHAGFDADVDGRIGLALEMQRAGGDAELFVAEVDRRGIRSEERRVGKEWRSRWAPDQ